MPLSCECGDDYEWFYHKPDDYSTLAASRRKRCVSCGSLIDLGAVVGTFECHRPPRHDIEENIYGDEVPMADKFMCERCVDLFFSLDDLGFCLTLGENMLELAKDYAELYGPGGSSKRAGYGHGSD